MVVVGSYAIRNSFYVNVMIIMGLIGYFFNRIRLPVTPIVLGLVLVELLSKNIAQLCHCQQEILLFFGSIVCVLFFMLIVLTIALQVRKRVIDVRSQKKLKEVNQV